MSRQQQLKQNKSGNKDLWRYAGLGMQIFASLGIAVFIGFKADQWLKPAVPLLVWILPFLIISLMIYKLVKDTSKRKDEDAEK